jgi:chemotaxis protein MotB
VSDGGHGGSRRRVIEEEHEEHENHERWLVSYADMMTLLMVLFIVMFAISQVDTKKFMALKTGLASGFGAPVAMLPGADGLLDVGGKVLPDSPNLSGSTGSQANSTAQLANPQAGQVNPEKVAELATATQRASVAAQVASLQQARARLQQALRAAGVANGATFRFDERGLVVSIATDDVLFDSGDATLAAGGRRILDALSPTLRSMPNQLSIDGHTNDIPIATARFPSNWELSTDRATGVLRYLASSRGIPADRMSATGFADTEPLLPPSDPRSLIVNRRVEIVVLAIVDNSAGRAVAALGNTPSSMSTASAPPHTGTRATHPAHPVARPPAGG